MAGRKVIGNERMLPSARVTSSQPMVRLERVGKSFGRRPVLEDVTFDVGVGEVVVLIGRSGSGKTTLLRCINLLEFPDCGAVYVAGEPLGTTGTDGRFIPPTEREARKKRARIGMVFQRFNL